jgi:hypothetical protein
VFFAQITWHRTSKPAASKAFWNSRCQDDEWQTYNETPGFTGETTTKIVKMPTLGTIALKYQAKGGPPWSP